MLSAQIQTELVETGTAIAEIAIATAIVIIGGALAAGLFLLSIRVEERFQRRGETGANVVENAIIAARWPLPIGILSTAIYIVLRDVLDLGSVYPWVGDTRLPQAIAIVLVAWWFASFLSRLVRVYGQRYLPEAELEDGTSLANLVSLGVKYLVWFIAILYLLTYLDISLTPILAGAGIAGIAIALASQDLLSNLFGGVIILLDQPLRVGDKVRIDPYTGTVLHIGLRSTRIRTLDGQVATVPNNRITTNIVVNYSAGTVRPEIHVPVTVDYGTPIGESRAMLEEIATAVPATAPPAMELEAGTVQIGELGEFGPIFILTFSARDETDPLAVKDMVYALVAEAVRGGRLAIAFRRHTSVLRESSAVGAPQGDGDRGDLHGHS